MNRSLLTALKSWKINTGRKPLLLRGARQVGKTWLLKSFGETSFPRFHYLNFEEDERLSKLFEQDLRPQRILNELRFYLDRSIDPRADLVIFDEIQRCPRAITSLKYFSEEMPDLALCAAGSLLGVALSDESFPVGKVTFLDLFPLSFEEFVDGTGKEDLVSLLRQEDLPHPLPESAHAKLWDLWKHYLVVGGLPEAVHEYRQRQENLYEALLAVRRLQRDLIDAHLADIAKHSGKANAMQIERLWRNVPQQLARSHDGGATRFRFRDAIPGLRGYERLASPLAWLVAAHLILKTWVVETVGSPLSAFSKENRFKLYFFDVGLLGALGGIEPAVLAGYNFGTYQGYVAENFVAQELVASGLSELFCWQGRTSEVEFVVSSGRETIPIEVKSGSLTHSRSLSVYEERYRPQRSFILSARNAGRQANRIFLPIYAAGRLSRLRD